MNLPACLLAAISLAFVPEVGTDPATHREARLPAATGHPHIPVATTKVTEQLQLHGFGKGVHEAATGLTNHVKAGRLVTLEFRITDANQHGVFLPELLVGGTMVREAATRAPGERVAFHDDDHGGMVYMGNGYYRVRWQTRPEWANSACTLTLSFESTQHAFAKVGGGDLTAKFSFRR